MRKEDLGIILKNKLDASEFRIIKRIKSDS